MYDSASNKNPPMYMDNFNGENPAFSIKLINSRNPKKNTTATANKRGIEPK